MATTSAKKYRVIEVNNPVSVERVTRPKPPFYVILLMGPTGSGKSTFIESLGLTDADRISSNKLEGFTQAVSTYKLNGVIYRHGNVANYLIDSPGFVDSKISEAAIVGMLQKWIKDHGNFNVILYLTPITQVRLPGSQRQVLKTFQKLTGADTAKNITIVTTMWDAIAGEKARSRAEETYKQLKGEIWKDFIKEGARIVKFHNTRESALSVIDDGLAVSSVNYFEIEKNAVAVPRESLFAANLYMDLQSRIQNLRLVIAVIQSELPRAEAQGEYLLAAVIRSQLEEAQKYLVKFQKELQDFGPPPPGVHPAHQVAEPGKSSGSGGEKDDEKLHRAMGVIMGDASAGAGEEQAVGNSEPKDLVPVTRTSISSELSHPIPLSSSPSPAVVSGLPAGTTLTSNISPPNGDDPPIETVPNSHSDADATIAAAYGPHHLHSAQELFQPQRGRISRAVDYLMSCRCCGKEVGANHDV